MSTGVDAKMCKLIVVDKEINSQIQFKQILGRGTRIREEDGKLYFTFMDFRNVSRLFADPEFDGEPVQIKVIGGDDPIPPDDEDEIDSGQEGNGGDYPSGEDENFPGDDEGMLENLLRSIMSMEFW